MADHSEFVFDTVWLGLLLGPMLGTGVVLLWRGRPRRPDVWRLVAGVVPLVVIVFAGALGLTFVDSRIGVVTLLVAYLLYCAAAFLMARTTITVQSAIGWVLVTPTVGGVLLGTVGAVGLALVMGDYVPRGGGALGPHHRYVVTTYGNATTSYGGSTVSVYRRVAWAPFLERRVFEASFDDQDVEVGTVSAEIDHSNARRALVMSKAVSLAIAPLN